MPIGTPAIAAEFLARSAVGIDQVRLLASAISGVPTMNALSAAPAATLALNAFGHFARGEIARAHSVADGGNAQIGKVGHYSITLGTPKKPCSRSRSVGQHLVAPVAAGQRIGIDRVVAQAQRVRDDRRHRFHIADNRPRPVVPPSPRML